MILLADGLILKIGDHAWVLGLDILLYIVVAAIVGAIAETIVGWRMPFGIIGAIIAGLIGIWLMTQVFVITGVSINGYTDLYLWGVPIIRALIGATIFVALWHLLTAGFRRIRHYRTA
jgi:uncharacterized membrane protein YeaQ/YmgE (transglycosylase-associated protein family)